MSTKTSDASVRRELWRSFASVARSYAAIEGTGCRKFTIQEDGDEIIARLGGVHARLTVHPDNGTGEAVFAQDCGRGVSEPLELGLDGTLRIGDSLAPLDIAAIDLLRRLTVAARRADEEAATIAALVAVI